MYLSNAKTCSLIMMFFLLAQSINHSVIADTPMINTGETVQVSKNVFIIPDNRINLVPNVGIIIGDDSVMVVDTGMGPKNALLVLEEVRKITDKPIAYLAITHFHPEHGMGAQAFPEDTRIIVPLAQEQELAEKGQAYIEFFNSMSPEIAELLAEVELQAPDITFDHKLEIDLGGQLVELYYFHTAHTRGDMFVFLPDQKLLFGGDIILERFFPIMPDPDSSALGWMATLKKLKALQPEIIIPGHGEVGGIDLIDQLLIYLNAMKVQVANQKKNGASLEQSFAALIPQFSRSYSHWDNPQWIQNAVEHFYKELEAR